MSKLPTYFAGLDLGQQGDYTALSILEQTEPSRYACRHLERFELGTPYKAIARRMAEIMRSPVLEEPPPPSPTTRLHMDAEELTYAQLDRRRRSLPVECIVDATGVGRPVVEMLETEGVYPVSVTITGGTSVTRGDGRREYRVPKRNLATTLQVLIQDGRLRVAEALPLADVLRREMQTFKVKVNTSTGHDSYEHWRDGDHDDLVLSVALAAWWAERPKAVLVA